MGLGEDESRRLTGLRRALRANRPARNAIRGLVAFSQRVALAPLPFTHLHLLRLLVGAMNSLSHRHTNRAPWVLTPMVMTQHIPRTHTVRYHALLILTLRNVQPKALHASAMRRHRTLAIIVRALGCGGGVLGGEIQMACTPGPELRRRCEQRGQRGLIANSAF